MSKDQDLTDALNMLLEGAAGEAINKAAPWSEEWVAKCIIFLAHSFFFIDPETAMNVFGGQEGIEKLMASERVERYFLQGYGFLFQKEEDKSESAFESAGKVSPNHPFVQFSLALIYTRHRKMDKAFEQISLMGKQNASHPLVYLLRDIVLKMAQ